MENEQSYPARIAIRVSSQGEFTYEPSVKRLSYGQAVTWTCAQGPFSIAFRDDTPFEKVDFQSAKSEDEYWSATTHSMGAARKPGHFHYAVAIYCMSEKRVFLDASCPEIIVNSD